METTRQSCPECGATLELPAAAIGRKARCPACQSTFVVSSPESGPTAAPSAASPGTPPASAVPSRAAPPSPSLADEATSASPPSKPHDSFGATGAPGASGQGWGDQEFSMPAQRPSAAADNPYAVRSGMASASWEPVEPGELRVRTPNIDSIVSASTAIFSHRWQPLVIGGLIVFGYNIASSIAGQIFPAIANLVGENVAIGASMLFQFVSSLLGFYLSVGLIRTTLSVARNQPTPVSVMFPHPGIFGRVVLTMLIPLLALGGLAAVVAGLGAAIYFAAGQADAAGIGIAVIGGLLVVGVYVAMFFLLWPAVYLAADNRASGMAALRTGFAVGITNKLNSFLFFLINMALGIIGVLTCCIGQIATTPAAFLVAGVGYLMMTSQPISDPNQPNPAVAPPGFSPTGFGSSEPYGTPS